jgi:hypothetical protein
MPEKENHQQNVKTVIVEISGDYLYLVIFSRNEQSEAVVKSGDSPLLQLHAQ